MQLSVIIQQLIKDEIILRHQSEEELSQRKNKIKTLIQDNCELSNRSYISREEWQDFCFRTLFNKSCHTNIPFSTYLNTLMPELGFPLGTAHRKLRVYRGLKWKK